MSRTHKEMEIPQHFKSCVAELASVCEKHGIGFIKGTIKPSFDDPWMDDFEFRWMEPGPNGRGGAEITTTVRDVVEVPQPEPTP